MESYSHDQADYNFSNPANVNEIEEGNQAFIEFDAVLMALDDREGLHPLTETLPVTILPVGNQPMLAFPLHQIIRAGFDNVIVVVSHSSHSAVSACLRQVLDVLPIKIRLETVPNDLGTADALRKIRSLIQHDFLVIDFDAIFTMPLQDLADMHRIRKSGVIALLNRMPEPEGETFKQKRKSLTADIGRHYVAIGDDDVLVYFRSALDIETEPTFHLSHRLLKRSFVTVQTRIQASGVAIFAYWILDVLDAKKGISSIYGELLPYLVEHQFLEPFPWTEIVGDQSRIRLSQEMSNSYDGECYPMNAVYAMMMPEDYYCIRINTISSYIHFQQKLLSSQADWRFVSAANCANDIVSRDGPTKVKIIRSLVGSGVTVAEGSIITDSVIGPGCVIGAGVSITGCFLMDTVVIKDACRLTGTVLCPLAVVQERNLMQNCVIGSSYKVECNCQIANETLFNSQQD